MATTDPTSGTPSTGTQSDKTNISTEVDGKNVAAPKQSDSLWSEPAAGASADPSDEEQAARDLAAKDAAAVARNPNKVHSRDAVEGVGGESFLVGVGEGSTSTAAEKAAAEEAALRAENPNEVVYRKGTKSDFTVG